MSQKISKPKSRKEHDQMKRGRINNKKSVSQGNAEPDKLNNKYSRLCEQCKNLIGFKKKTE